MEINLGVSKEITSLLSSVTATTFAQWIGGYTVIKNQKAMEYRREVEAWIAAGRQKDKAPASNAATSHLQGRLEFLKDLPCQIRRNAGSKFMEACNASKAGLRGLSKPRGKHKKRNCLLTRELFDIAPGVGDQCKVCIKPHDKKTWDGQYLLIVDMPFKAAKAANSLYLSRKGNRFWISMSHKEDRDVLTEDQVRHRLSGMSDSELHQVVRGYDAGGVVQIAASNGEHLHFSVSEQRALDKLERRKKRYQRRYARQSRANDRAAIKTGAKPLKNGTVKRKRTNNEKRALDDIRRQDARIADIKKNRSHHISKHISETVPLAAVFENTNWAALRRKPKPKKDPATGKWLKNGRAAKRALNRKMASVNPGQIRSMTAYKLAHRGKLLIKVPAAYTSQRCSKCWFTHEDNRKTQELFHCKQCGYHANADDNASANIKQLGILTIRDEAFLGKRKTARKISVRKSARKQAGQCCTAREEASSGSGVASKPPLGEQATAMDQTSTES